MVRKSVFAAILCLTGIVSAKGAAPEIKLFDTPASRSEIYNYAPVSVSDPTAADPELSEGYIAEADSLDGFALVPFDATYYTMPGYYFRPVVFDTYHLLDPIPLVPGGERATFGWLIDLNQHANLIRQASQQYVLNYPYLVKYNEAHLPEPPKQYIATVDPATAMIVIDEVKPVPPVNTEMEVVFEKRHWLRTFNAGLQFSQAYVSPNWYQGGNNNVNAILNLFYNVKLNQKFHPNFLFETTVQYKLGMNSAPDDSIRSYSISEDLFQFNLTAGYKATKKWYYSTNISFKTQLLNNYKSNSRSMKAAFLSPGELNVGLGMTYNHANAKKTFTLDASISPISWNMKTCINSNMNETDYGIKPGRKMVSEIGSNAEVKMTWKIAENISYRSRFFVFTDYDYIQSDWENTFQFNINKFLSTQLYIHARYDSSTPREADSKWHKLQLKEILSFGFSYNFSSI